MLTQVDIDYVTPLLLRVATLAPVPRTALLIGLVPELQEQFGDSTPRVLVGRAIDLCVKDAYRHDPPAIVTLLDTLLHDQERIASIIARVRTPPPPAADPFDALVLDTKLPFLDRRPTRRNLSALKQVLPVRPVVVINGEKDRGKSYTREFIDHVCRYLDGVHHCGIEIIPKQGASVGPRELAVDIVTRMGGNPKDVPPPDTNLDRWAQDLANWIIAEARESQIKWWIVLDGFNRDELRDDTGLLIIKLASSLTTGLAQRLHRLVLIDFDRTILTLQPTRVAVETTAGIPRAAVETCVRQVISLKPQLSFDEIFAKVIEGFSDPILDLPELGQRLSDLIASVEPEAT